MIITDTDDIHEIMLERVSDEYQKTVGFPAYDFLRAFAVAASSLADDINTAMGQQNVDNLEGVELDTWIQQRRGLDRKYGTFAESDLTITAGAGSINAGDMFSTASGIDFYAIADGTYKTGDTFRVRAYDKGEVGNVKADQITKIPVNIVGIGAVTNKAPAFGGTDSESDLSYRERYYSSLRNPDNGSNQQAYKNWAEGVDGVGRAKVFPGFNGPNTVEVCVTSQSHGAVTGGIIADVQKYIDPNKNGDGSGVAPIGAMCNVTSAVELPINISVSVTLTPGYNLTTVKENVKNGIIKYLDSISFLQSFVSYGKISNEVNDAEGVADYNNLTINGGKVNVELEERQTPIIGTVIVT